MRKWIITLLFVCVSFLLFACGCSGCRKNEPASYKINFIIDGEQYLTETVVFGRQVNQPTVENREGYVFKCWYTSEEYIEQWDFEKPIYKSANLYAYWVQDELETFNVSFADGETVLRNDKVLKGDSAERYVPEKTGYIFTEWTYQGQPFDFATPVYKDITLNAVWDTIKYQVKFTADNEIIAEEYYTVDNRIVKIPDIPEKEHYTAKWTIFEYNLEDIEVPVIYTPINYLATFFVDNEVFLELDYSVEDEIEIPQVPEKRGYDGSWNGLPIEGGNVTVTAEYTPIPYTVTFEVDNIVIDTLTYNIENKDITPPEVPERPGYEGKWVYTELDIGDITINAVYTIKVLNAYFSVDNEIIAAREFTVENKNIDIPEVPYKEGFVGAWEPFALGSNDITVIAKYSPIKYTASFIAEDKVIAEVEFTVNDAKLPEPQIPEKTGYVGHWESYSIIADDIRIEAVYTVVVYYASFVFGDGNIVKVPYTIIDSSIDEPTLPHNENYVTRWEKYSLPYKDFEINIQYIERISSVTVGNLQFTLLDNDTYSLTKYLVNDNMPLGSPESEVVIPEEVNYLPVTAIGEETFAFKTNFETISIPNSVVNIGAYALSYTNIKNITLPENLIEINNTFIGCTLLESVTINSKAQKICENAFTNCSSLKSINIPKSVKYIGANAFSGCSSLENVVFENCDGWSVYNKDSNALIAELESEKLSDSTLAAQYLTDENFYLKRYWKHGEN